MKWGERKPQKFLQDEKEKIEAWEFGMQMADICLLQPSQNSLSHYSLSLSKKDPENQLLLPDEKNRWDFDFVGKIDKIKSLYSQIHGQNKDTKQVQSFGFY